MQEETGFAAGRLAQISRAADLRNLIVKLRWIGLEDDALRLHHRLKAIAPEECADLWVHDTD